jgi:hypothetical protein
MTAESGIWIISKCVVGFRAAASVSCQALRKTAMRHFYLFAVFTLIRNHETESSHPDRFGRLRLGLPTGKLKLHRSS